MQNISSSRLLSKNLKIKIYRNIILPTVLYGCGTWSLTLREERKLRVFENMVLRRIFGPRRDEVTGEWWRFHKEELNDLFCYRTIILPTVLYGCGTWSLTLREERKLRVFENMVLRRIFGPWNGGDFITRI